MTSRIYRAGLALRFEKFMGCRDENRECEAQRRRRAWAIEERSLWISATSRIAMCLCRTRRQLLNSAWERAEVELGHVIIVIGRHELI